MCAAAGCGVLVAGWTRAPPVACGDGDRRGNRTRRAGWRVVSVDVTASGSLEDAATVTAPLGCADSGTNSSAVAPSATVIADATSAAAVVFGDERARGHPEGATRCR